jgi:hypothetical protein
LFDSAGRRQAMTGLPALQKIFCRHFVIGFLVSPAGRNIKLMKGIGVVLRSADSASTANGNS